MNPLPTRFFLHCLVALAGLAAATGATGQPAALEPLLGCQKLSDAAARLACYDREVPRLAPGLPAAGPAAAAIAAPTPPAPPEARFGLRAPSGDAAPASIVSALPEGFAGWRAGQRIRLANGQVWRIADDSSAFVSLKSLRVVVREGALGAFYMDFDGDKRSPRVRRVE